MIEIKDHLTCTTSNCLYICTCQACGKGSKKKKQVVEVNNYKGQYTGQTKRKIKERWAEHKSSMEDPYTKKPVGRHFQERGHRGAEDCTILPFMKIRSSDPHVRLIMEKKAISDFGLIENGLNKKLG